jgi:adenylate cyclase/guanylate cyclase
LNIGRKTRDAIAFAAIVLVCAAVSVSPVFNIAHGLSIDILTALRWEMFGSRQDPAASPAVVVAIDEETYQVPPFKGSPMLTWTGEIGRKALARSGGRAKVVGFDIVFEKSIEQSETGGGVRRKTAVSIAISCARCHQAAGKVLGGSRGDQPVRLRDSASRFASSRTSALSTPTDGDDIVRRLPLTFSVDGNSVPSMALELAARALNARPESKAGKTVALAG